MIQQPAKDRQITKDELQNKENTLKFICHKMTRAFFSTNENILENTDRSCSPENSLNLKSPDSKNKIQNTPLTLPKKKITCNCKNSQCLKLYCECFSTLGFCDPNVCSCKECSNTKENEVIIFNSNYIYLIF
jgi:hypothetical protein